MPRLNFGVFGRSWLVIAALLSYSVFGLAQQSCSTSVMVTPYTLSGGRMQMAALPPLNAQVNGKGVQLNLGKPVRQPLRVILLLDASGSMQPWSGSRVRVSRWTLALQVARKVVLSAPAGSTFGILAFSGNDRYEVPLTKDLDWLTAKLNGLISYRGDPQKRNGKTPLWDSFAEADTMLLPGSPSDAIVAFTDGGDNSSRNGEGRLIQDLGHAGARVFSIVLGQDEAYAPVTNEERSGLANMRLLARERGGYSQELHAELLALDNPKKTDEALATAATVTLSLLENSYPVELEIQPGRKPSKLKLDSQIRNIQLLYPRHIAACSPTP